jgi:hypothetical protein
MAGGLVDALTVVIVIGCLFGLGLFFLIAGRLSSPSLERSGPARFARERLIRLGTPVLAYTLLVSPALEYFHYRENEDGTRGFWSFFGDQIWHLGPGPTWFLEALLAFSLGYGLLRSSRPPRREPSQTRCGSTTWRASCWRSPSARLPPTSPIPSAVSSFTCSSGCSRSI